MRTVEWPSFVSAEGETRFDTESGVLIHEHRFPDPSEITWVKVVQLKAGPTTKPANKTEAKDAVVFDPDPIRGGKIVIQAKRYTGTVDVSAIRDLYGAVINEGANKGILVTTSHFGPDAYSFAKDKPLTLLSGNELLGLLEKYGYKFRIDLTEVKLLI